jgi:predicted ATPase
LAPTPLAAVRFTARPAGSAVPFVGREAERALIEQHLAGEGPPLLLLAGEPGIGKSRLLSEASQWASAQGWRVLAGGCHPRSRQEPFAPLIEALSGALSGLSPAEQRDRLRGCGWLVRFLPELADLVPTPAASWNIPPEQERRLMFAAVLRFLANSASPAGLLLVLDDLHWSGTDALDLVSSLLRSSQETPLRVIGTYRSTEVQPTDPFGGLIAELAPAHLVREQRLEQLSPQEATTLLTGLLEEAGVTASKQRQQVLARTGCLPFFLVSYVQALRAGVLPDTERDVPWNVAQSIRQRVLVLPEGARELLGCGGHCRPPG